LNTAQDILQKTEEYIDIARELTEEVPPASEIEEYYEDEPTTSEMEELSEDEPHSSETEEFPEYSSQSNYSQMIEAIAANSRDSFLNNEEDI
jgi:hypothetical protein